MGFPEFRCRECKRIKKFGDDHYCDLTHQRIHPNLPSCLDFTQAWRS